MGPGGMNMKTNTNIKLPLSFILYGLVALVVGEWIMFFSGDRLLLGTFRVPDIWMAAHFLLLGFAVMIAMGSMYQLVPAAFSTPIWSESFGFVQLVVTAGGITLFSILLGMNPKYVLYGGIMAIGGILMFIVQMVMTILQQKKKTIMTAFVLGALICFFLTIAAGFWLMWNIAFASITNHSTVLYSHIVLGVAGWFTLLIFGFSYKLVPMFSLSHSHSMKWAKPTFFTYIVGLFVMLGAFWTGSGLMRTIGWFLLFLGFVFFSLDIEAILAKRLRKNLDKPFSFTLLAICIGLGIHFLALLLDIISVDNPAIWGWLIFLYVTGWIIFSILGYLYKIVPFLWWSHKYSERRGKEKVPLPKDMVNEKLAVVLYILFIIGSIGVVVAALCSLSPLVSFFQGLLAFSSLLYMVSIVRILMI